MCNTAGEGPKYHPIEDRFDIMQVREVNTTTIKPTPANSPRLYNNPKFQLLVLFTRFFTAFGNTVIPAIARQIGGKDVTNVRRMGALSGVAVMIASAYYMTLVREDITGYSYRDRDDPLRIIDATDRAGLLGMATRLYPLFSAYKYNMGSKYVANVIGGPVAGDVAKLIDAAKGTRKQRARWMANQTPLMTVTPESEQIMYEFYLEFLNAIED